MSLKNLKTFDQLNEAKSKPPLSITSFVLVTNSVYATMKHGIKFTAKINGIPVTGYLEAKYEYTHRGMDIDELEVGGKRIRIANGGGSYRSYAVSIGRLKEKEKQPKNLSFTGPYYDVSNIGNEFKQSLMDVVTNHPEWLTDEFKRTFLKSESMSENLDPSEENSEQTLALI